MNLKNIRPFTCPRCGNNNFECHDSMKWRGQLKWSLSCKSCNAHWEQYDDIPDTIPRSLEYKNVTYKFPEEGESE